MNSVVKLLFGIIFFIIGIYWYIAPYIGQHGLSSLVPQTIGTTFQAFLVVFFGLFGLFLIVFGLIVIWIEIEDLKWSSKEKQQVQTKKVKVKS